jgi:beta-1,4-mannosyltransferase
VSAVGATVGKSRIYAFPRWNLNPYLTQLYLASEADGWEIDGCVGFDALTSAVGRGVLRRGDVLHVHWTATVTAGVASREEAMARVARFDRLLRSVREKGVHVLWTVHNELAHDTEYPEVEIAIAQSLCRHADLVIQLHDRTRAHLADSYELPADRLVTLRHSSYAGIYPSLPDRDLARDQLGVPRGVPTVGLIGRLRPYKGVDVLLDAVRIAAQSLPDLTVLLAGQTPPDHVAAIEAMLPEGVRVIRHHTFLDAADIGTWLQASNVIALPYRRVLNSGSALMAATLGRPVIIPDDTPLAEVYAGEAWVEPYAASDGVEDLARAIVRLAPGDPVREQAALDFAASYTPYDMSRDFLRILDGLEGARR